MSSVPRPAGNPGPAVVPFKIVRPDTSPEQSPIPTDERRRRREERRRKRAVEWTLRTFLEEWAIPRYFHAPDFERSERTIKDYRSTLVLWEASTGNPTIALIARAHCRRFHAHLRSLGLSDRTRAKHVNNLNFLLKLTGRPKGEELPGARLRSKVPEVKRVAYHYAPPRDGWTLDETARVVETCDRIVAGTLKVSGVDAAEAGYIKALVLWTHNTALRPMTTFGATWSMIDDDHWFHPPKEIMKGKKEGFALYLNRHALAAAESVRRPGQEKLFPRSLADVTMHRHMRGVIAAAGVKVRPGVRKKGQGLYNGRKCALTELARDNPIAAKIVAGHAGDVTQSHYIDPSMTVACLDRIRQPGRWRQQAIRWTDDESH